MSTSAPLSAEQERQIADIDDAVKALRSYRGSEHMKKCKTFTEFVVNEACRKNFLKYCSVPGQKGRSFLNAVLAKEKPNERPNLKLIDARGRQLSLRSSARAEVLKDLRELAAVMIKQPHSVNETRLQWLYINLTEKPAPVIHLAELYLQFPPREWSIGVAAASNNGSSVASVGDVNGSQVGLPTGGGMGGDASSVASPDTSEQDRQMISTPSAATPSASGAFDMDMDSPPSSAMNMSSPSPTSHTAGRGASTIRGPVVVDQIAYGNTAPAPRADIVAHSNDERLVPTRITRDLMTRFLSGFARDRSINGRLRKNEMLEQDEEFLACSELVLRTIPPYPFPEAFVYRCIDLTPENALSFQDQMASGQPITLTERAFTFTCAFSPQQQMSREDVAHNTKNTYIAIRSRSGRLVRQYCGPSFQDEWEVLFFYGTKFRVLSFEDTKPGEEHGAGGQGRYRIVMEEVWSHIPGLEAAE